MTPTNDLNLDLLLIIYIFIELVSQTSLTHKHIINKTTFRCHLSLGTLNVSFLSLAGLSQLLIFKSCMVFTVRILQSHMHITCIIQSIFAKQIVICFS